MNWTKKLVMAAAVASMGIFGVACTKQTQVRDDKAGVGGAANEGKGELGDGKVGQHEGVLNDGEGPIENQDGKVGKNEGVYHDGEGPLEEHGDNKIGKNKGVINDGEGPIEENTDQK